MVKSTKDRAQYLRDYQREWMRKRRESFFLNKSCKRCGATHDLVISYGYNHLRYTRSLFSYTKENQEALASKGRILCNSCKNTLLAKRNKPAHGTDGRYRHHKCRCRKCKDAHNSYNRRYRILKGSAF